MESDFGKVVYEEYKFGGEKLAQLWIEEGDRTINVFSVTKGGRDFKTYHKTFWRNILERDISVMSEFF